MLPLLFWCFQNHANFNNITLINDFNTQMDDPLSSASESSVHNLQIFPYLQMLSFIVYPK